MTTSANCAVRLESIEDVVVVAATNLLEDVDDAILRSGRFDERIEVPASDAPARREILAVHLRDRPVEESIDWDTVVTATEGYAASGLALLADNAARNAMQADGPLGDQHLREAVSEMSSTGRRPSEESGTRGRPQAQPHQPPQLSSSSPSPSSSIETVWTRSRRSSAAFGRR